MGSMKVEINPEGIDAEYLRGLNTCFPHWGDERMAQWAFRRALSGNPASDLMVLREDDGELLAGSAVSYRTVRLPNGNEIRAGIMTGSWTLPAARGRGCFARIIEESAAITREREGALLLAFVTEENPSRRQLLKAGAAAVPTWYLVADGSAKEDVPAELAPAAEADVTEAFSAWQTQKNGRAHFSYGTFDDWKDQFIDRPAEVSVVRDASGSLAVIERHAETDRIQAHLASSLAAAMELFKTLHAYSVSRGRKVFSFTTDIALADGCEAIGFRKIPGYLTVMAVNWACLQKGSNIEATVPIDNSPLTDSDSPWFLGVWEIQSGDRM
jgi:hypothetical protein